MVRDKDDIIFLSWNHPSDNPLKGTNQDEEYHAADQVEDQVRVCHLLAGIATQRDDQGDKERKEGQEDQDTDEVEEEVGNGCPFCRGIHLCSHEERGCRCSQVGPKENGDRNFRSDQPVL